MFFRNSALKFKHHLVFLKVFGLDSWGISAGSLRGQTLCIPMWEGERNYMNSRFSRTFYRLWGMCLFARQLCVVSEMGVFDPKFSVYQGYCLL